MPIKSSCDGENIKSSWKGALFGAKSIKTTFQLETTDPEVLQDHVALNNNLTEEFIENSVLTSLIPVLRKTSQGDG